MLPMPQVRVPGPGGTPAASGGVITFDAATDGGDNGGSTNTRTYNHTVGSGANRLLIINLVGDSSTDDITSVTYNGVSCTLVAKIQGTRWSYMYYLLNPASGTNAVSITSTGTHYLISDAASYAGVKQSAQPDASTTHQSGSSPQTTSLTTVNNNSWIIACGWAYTSVAAGAGTISRVIDGHFSATGIFESSSNPVAPGVHNTVITWNQTDLGSVVVVSFQPA